MAPPKRCDGRGLTLTQEEGGSANKPRIPFVCQQEKVRHINLLLLIEEEDWVF